MRLNNKGFAISSMMYSILLLFLMLVLGVLGTLGSRKIILDKIKGEIITDLTQNYKYTFSFEYKNALIANTSKVGDFAFSLLDGVKIIDQNGNMVDAEITTQSSPEFNSTINGVYTVTYTSIYEGYLIEATRIIEVIDPITYEYASIGAEQTFTTPLEGVYKAELWGAQGGSVTGVAYNKDGTERAESLTYNGGNGAYTAGQINLNKGEKLYLHVGGSLETMNNSLVSGTATGGYNGGGTVSSGAEIYGAPGGGATDIRLASGAWNDFNGLKSRIMVAAGGGGANFRNSGYGEGNGGEGGTINGIDGYEALTEGSYFRDDFANGYSIGNGATQIKAGNRTVYLLNGTIDVQTVSGVKYFGGYGIDDHGQTGGGSGYYIGGSSYHGGAGGGSSFISGHDGCDAITENSTEELITHTGQSIHYSGKSFVNTNMIAGNADMPTYDNATTMVGNKGHGYAKITALIVENGLVATNLVNNSGFEDGTNGWTFKSIGTSNGTNIDVEVPNVVIDKNNAYNGNSLKIEATTNELETEIIMSENFNSNQNHKYYVRFYHKSSIDNVTGGIVQHFILGNSIVDSSMDSLSKEWTSYSRLFTYNEESSKAIFRIDIDNALNALDIYYDDIMLLDLTQIYGAGNEPSLEWCDNNIKYFDGTGIVPIYLVNDSGTSNTVLKSYEVGEEVTFDPGDGVSTTWNVLSDNGSTVTLMLNENLGDVVAWQSSNVNADGPVTALEALNERTSTWNNVNIISAYEYVNNAGGSTYTYGYEKVTIANGKAVVTKQDTTTEVEISGISRARLITGWEAAAIMNDQSWNPNTYTGNIGPNWIYTSLNSDSAPYGYWTLSNRSDTSNNIWYIAYTGSLHHGSNGSASDNSRNGIRPVIEIPKTKLQ